MRTARLASAICLVLIALGSGCKNSLSNTVKEDVARSGEHATAAPKSYAAITGHDLVVIEFSAPMATVSFTGTMIPAGPGPADWSLDKKTLYLRPLTLWPRGSGTLTINGTTENGLPFDQASQDYTIFYGTCVGTLGNDTSGSGSAGSPVRSIAKGLFCAEQKYSAHLPAEVRVATGDYSYSWVASPTERIILKNGYSLRGGYANDWSDGARTANKSLTTISDQSTSGGSSLADPNRAIEVYDTSNSVIDCFTITGSGNAAAGAYRCALFCNGNIGSASPTISNCAINGGASAGNNSYGLLAVGPGTTSVSNSVLSGGTGQPSAAAWISSSNISLSHCSISGGSSALGFSYGINASGSSSVLTVGNCKIDAGTGLGSYGVYASSVASSGTFWNNTIFGGSGMAASNSGIKKIAVYLASSSLVFRNNTIEGSRLNYSGTAYPQSSCGFYISGCSPTIENNIVTLGGNEGYCIYEAAAGSSPASLRNNDLYRGSNGTALYRSGTPSEVNAIATINGWTAFAANNVSADPVFKAPGTFDYHFTDATSPSSVTQGGIVGSSWGFADDIETTLRGGAWSMGAYEY